MIPARNCAGYLVIQAPVGRAGSAQHEVEQTGCYLSVRIAGQVDHARNFPPGTDPGRQMCSSIPEALHPVQPGRVGGAALGLHRAPSGC